MAERALTVPMSVALGKLLAAYPECRTARGLGVSASTAMALVRQGYAWCVFDGDRNAYYATAQAREAAQAPGVRVQNGVARG